MKMSKANYKLLVLVIFTAIACAAAARDLPKKNELANTKDMVVPHSVDDDQGEGQDGQPWRGGIGGGPGGGISGGIGAGGSGGIGGGVDIGGLGGRFSGSTGGGLGGSFGMGPRDGGGLQAGAGVGAGLGGSVSGSIGGGRFGGGFGGDDGSATP